MLCAAFLPCRPDSTAQTMTLVRNPGWGSMLRRLGERGDRYGFDDGWQAVGMSTEEWQARCDLAAAYRLCALYGWTDLNNTHISARLRAPGILSC